MIIRTLQTTVFLVVLLCATVSFGQTNSTTPTNAVLLTVSGEVASPLKLTAADLAKLPRCSVRAKGHDGKQALFDGVELSDVLKLAGVKFGEQLRGKDLALFRVVGAADSYRAVFALPELDPDSLQYYRKAVPAQSPGLPRFAATLGKQPCDSGNPNGVSSVFMKHPL